MERCLLWLLSPEALKQAAVTLQTRALGDTGLGVMAVIYVSAELVEVLNTRLDV